MWRFAAILAPLIFPVVIMLAVNLSMNPPGQLLRHTAVTEPNDPDRCSWYCHNHGCPHSATRGVLEPLFGGPDGLFSYAVRALHGLGGHTFTGYALANLVIFCLLWPAAMYGLYLVLVWQLARIYFLTKGRSEIGHG